MIRDTEELKKLLSTSDGFCIVKTFTDPTGENSTREDVSAQFASMFMDVLEVKNKAHYRGLVVPVVSSIPLGENTVAASGHWCARLFIKEGGLDDIIAMTIGTQRCAIVYPFGWGTMNDNGDGLTPDQKIVMSSMAIHQFKDLIGDKFTIMPLNVDWEFPDDADDDENVFFVLEVTDSGIN